MSARPDPFVGWRVWHLLGDATMVSPIFGGVWVPGTNAANCTEGRECLQTPCPHSRCGCGFHAWSRLTQQRWQEVQSFAPPSVVGLALGWGLVAIHGDEGWRASHAQVLALFEDLTVCPQYCRHTVSRREVCARALAREAAETYGVPCLSLASAMHFGFLGEMGALPPVGLGVET